MPTQTKYATITNFSAKISNAQQNKKARYAT